MKHTFVYIDNLMILLNDVPRSLDTEEDKANARIVVDKISYYSETLRKLIDSHKTDKYLRRLHESHIKEVENWADKVSALFKKLDDLLAVLEEDIGKLRRVIRKEPEKWVSKVQDLALGMVLTGLHDEEEDMKRFRNIAIFQMHELKGMIDSKEHLAELREVIKSEEQIAELLE